MQADCAIGLWHRRILRDQEGCYREEVGGERFVPEPRGATLYVSWPLPALSSWQFPGRFWHFTEGSRPWLAAAW